MPQVINEQPGLGYRLGTGLGEGFGSAVNQLTNYHLQDLVQKKQAQAQQQELQRSSDRLQQFGLSPEASNYVASLPAKQQWEAVMALSDFNQPQQEQQTEMQQALSGLAPQPQQQQPNQQELLQSLAGLGQQPKIDPRMQALVGLVPSVGGKPLGGLSQLGPQQQQVAPEPQAPIARQPEIAAQAPQPESPQQEKRAEEARKPLTPKEIERPIKPAEKLALKKQLQLQEKAEKALDVKQKEINKETEDFYKATIKEQQAAKKSDLRLGRLEQLVKKGNLPNATWYRLFKDLSEEGLGINSSLAGAALGALAGGIGGTLLGGGVGAIPGITAGQTTGAAVGGLIGSVVNPIAKGLGSLGLANLRSGSPDVEEFEKLSTDFIREAKEIFGARVTDRDLAAFMQIIPTLMQTNSGKNRVIENMRAFNKANHVRYNAMKQIIETNGGKRPANLELLVDEYTQPQLDKLAEQFREGVVTTTALPPAQGPTPLAKRKPSGVIGTARQRAGL